MRNLTHDRRQRRGDGPIITCLPSIILVVDIGRACVADWGCAENENMKRMVVCKYVPLNNTLQVINRIDIDVEIVKPNINENDTRRCQIRIIDIGISLWF